MAEVATIFNSIQLGVEGAGTPGTPVAVTKSFSTFELTPHIRFNNKPFRPAGKKFNSMAVPGREWVEAQVKGMVSYGEIVYVLNSLIKTTTAVADASTAQKWTFTPTNGSDACTTYTIEQGYSGACRKFSYARFTGGTFTFTREGVEFSGDLIAQLITEAASWTGTGVTAAETTIIPAAGDDLYVAVGDSFAALTGAAHSTRVLSAEWSYTNAAAPVWVVDSAKTSFAATVDTAPSCQLKLLMEADAEAIALLTNMRAGSLKFVRLSATGAEIETGKPYAVQFEGAYTVAEPSAYRDEDGVYAIEWTMDATWDNTGAKAVFATVRNTIAAL